MGDDSQWLEVMSVGDKEGGYSNLLVDQHGQFRLDRNCFTLDKKPINTDLDEFLRNNGVSPNSPRVGREVIGHEISIQEAAKWVVEKCVPDELADYFNKLIDSDNK